MSRALFRSRFGGTAPGKVTMRHPARRDTWVAALLVTGASAMTGGGLVLASLGLTGVPAALVPGASLLLAGLLQASILLGTSYEITPDALVIRSGPVRWAVPLDRLAEVVPKDNFFGGPEWGFALSRVGLHVRYRMNDGRLTWPIRISPRDRAAFLLELTEAVPQLHVGEDGSLRRPA